MNKLAVYEISGGEVIVGLANDGHTLRYVTQIFNGGSVDCESYDLPDRRVPILSRREYVEVWAKRWLITLTIADQKALDAYKHARAQLTEIADVVRRELL